MAKRFGRPALEYRYEHYDPRMADSVMFLLGWGPSSS
jgi:hypothetical protein